MDEKRKEDEARELTPEEIDDLLLRNRLRVESITRKFPNTTSPIPTRMLRSSLALTMHRSVTSSLMKTVTSL